MCLRRDLARSTFNTTLDFIGRGERIRTSDPLRPRQVRYQAALRPDLYDGMMYRRAGAVSKRFGSAGVTRWPAPAAEAPAAKPETPGLDARWHPSRRARARPS